MSSKRVKNGGVLKRKSRSLRKRSKRLLRQRRLIGGSSNTSLTRLREKKKQEAKNYSQFTPEEKDNMITEFLLKKMEKGDIFKVSKEHMGDIKYDKDMFKPKHCQHSRIKSVLRVRTCTRPSDGVALGFGGVAIVINNNGKGEVTLLCYNGNPLAVMGAGTEGLQYFTILTISKNDKKSFERKLSEEGYMLAESYKNNAFKLDGPYGETELYKKSDYIGGPPIFKEGYHPLLEFKKKMDDKLIHLDDLPKYGLLSTKTTGRGVYKNHIYPILQKVNKSMAKILLKK